MQISELRIAVDASGWCTANICPESNGKGFHCFVQYSDDDDDLVTISTQRGETKVYKTLDAAYRDLQRIAGECSKFALCIDVVK